MTLKKLSLLAAVAVFVAGCSSVPLDSPPVEDRSSGGAAGGSSVVTPASTSAGTVDDSATRGVAIPAFEARVVYFDYDSFVIKPEFQALIEANAKVIKASAGRKIVLEGHADERGGREYNLALGQKRAEAVRRALNLLGVADSQLEAVSFGKEKPAVQGTGEAVWAKNRRVEISYR